MKPTIYLAAPYQAREIIKDYRDRIIEPAGIEVTSQWLDETYAVSTEPGELDLAEVRHFAKMDLKDVHRADHFATFSVIGNPDIEENSRGGRHYEMGYARALNKTIWVVGGRQHIFEYLVHEYRIVFERP